MDSHTPKCIGMFDHKVVRLTRALSCYYRRYPNSKQHGIMALVLFHSISCINRNTATLEPNSMVRVALSDFSDLRINHSYNATSIIMDYWTNWEFLEHTITRVFHSQTKLFIYTRVSASKHFRSDMSLYQIDNRRTRLNVTRQEYYKTHCNDGMNPEINIYQFNIKTLKYILMIKNKTDCVT